MTEFPLPDRNASVQETSIEFRKPGRYFGFGAAHAAILAASIAVILEVLYYRHAVASLRASEPIPARGMLPARPLAASPPWPVPEPEEKGGTPRVKPVSRHVPKTVPPLREVDPPVARRSFTADDRVREAYEALARNDLPKAKRLYEEAATMAPEHRQAQLGLAAVAVRQNDLSGARTHYQRLLEQDPGDGDAAAGLMNLISDNPTEQESLLKLLIARGARQASVYNQLGNIYAAEGRWEEAYRSYSEAMRRDALVRKEHGAGDADIAFNVAVSLDHLGQTAAAVRYYRLAIACGRKGPSTFPTGEARARLAALEAADGGA